MKRTLGAVLVVLAVLVFVAQPQAIAGKKDDTVVMADRNKLVSLDMYFAPGIVGINLTKYYMDTLLWRKPGSSELLPCLAKSWKWVDDVTLEFELREGITFHNGEAFDADDVVYTMNWAKDPASKVRVPSRINWIKEAVKMDKYRVRILCKKPSPAAPKQLAMDLTILPNEYHAKVGVKEFQVKAVGTGPYKVKSFKPGGKIVLEKNENYFKDSPKGQPKIGNIVFIPMREVQTQIAAAMTGKVDALWRVPAKQAQQLKKTPNLTVKTVPTLRSYFINLDAAGRSGKNPFQNKKVRQAANYAINKKAIIENLVPGSQPMKTFCHPDQFGCYTDVAQYDYNPEKAKKLLAEAGYPNGFEVALETKQRDMAPVVEAISNNLNAVGIKAKIMWVASETGSKRRSAGKQRMSFIGWGSGGMLDVVFTNSLYYYGGRYDYCRDDKMKELAIAGASTVDPQKRMEHYKAFFTRMAEEAYIIPLYISPTTYVYNKDLDLFTDDLEWPAVYRAGWK